VRTARIGAAALLTALALAGCSEQPQTLGQRKADTQAWAGANNAFVAPGWKVGDQASWEEQMRTRAQRGQNEYVRAVSAP
jgi:starvation-inducible outer membrane lipoprotein